MTAGLVLSGRFRLIEELGRGGMGAVWRAEDLELEAPAAVKLIDAQFVESPEALSRFRREAKAAAAIRSTHVVQILEYGVENGIPYIAMELLKGETLAKRLEKVKQLSPQFTLMVMTHVARALSLAHENGIVHRDLKPENVFLVREMDEDVGKVLDFGIARKLGALGDTGGFQTQTGAVLGTPYYMSPEHTMGQFVDHRSDIWSFGVIAFECLTGKLPFEHDSLGGLFRAICVAPPPIPSQVGSVPIGFDAWFARATARDPNDRFQSANDAVTELRAICRNTTSLAVPMSSSALSAQQSFPKHTAAFDQTAPPVPGSAKVQPAALTWKPWGIGIGATLVLAVCIFLYSRHSQDSTSQAESAKATAASTIPAIEPAVAASVSPSAPSSIVAAASVNQLQLPAASFTVDAAASSTPAPKVSPRAVSVAASAARATSATSRRMIKPPPARTKKPDNVAGF